MKDFFATLVLMALGFYVWYWISKGKRDKENVLAIEEARKAKARTTDDDRVRKWAKKANEIRAREAAAKAEKAIEEYETEESPLDKHFNQYDHLISIFKSYRPPKDSRDPPVDRVKCEAFYEALEAADASLQTKITQINKAQDMYWAARALDDPKRMMHVLGACCALAHVPAKMLDPPNLYSTPSEDDFRLVAWPFEKLAEFHIESDNRADALATLTEGVSVFKRLGLEYDIESWFSQMNYADHLDEANELRQECIDYIAKNPGVIQSELIKSHPDFTAQMLYWMADECLIVRVKKGRSYQLYPVS
ncbi:hypothetical protein [Limnohabitans sp.]|uniref:hypothetical protein n=1 Tax=Limnohabitans sp. TaxID=1907725 RepID=UPI00286F1CD9|nr:hypothetical protein [Limnohabitans sp.]